VLIFSVASGAAGFTYPLPGSPGWVIAVADWEEAAALYGTRAPMETWQTPADQLRAQAKPVLTW
jgi:hypothetical protein